MGNRTDNFNRTDSASSLGTPSDGGSAWSVLQGTWGISSNKGYNVSSGLYDAAVLESSLSDCTIQVTISSGSIYQAIVCRATDENNNITGFIEPFSSALEIYKRVASTFTLISSTYSGTINSGDVFALIASGNSLTLTQNGVTRCTATDSFNATATKHGILTYNDSGARFDDFSITGSSPSVTTYPGFWLCS